MSDAEVIAQAVNDSRTLVTEDVVYRKNTKMNYKRLIPCVLVAVSLTSIAEQKDIILHGLQIAQPDSGLMKTLDMVEQKAIEENRPWLSTVSLIRGGFSKKLDVGDVEALKKGLYKPPENTPILIRELASMALFNQTGDLDDILNRLRSGDNNLIKTALSTADIMPHNNEFRDVLFNMILTNAVTMSDGSLASYLYFALRNFNNPDDTEILRSMLNGVSMTGLMRQAIFRSLIYDDPEYRHSLAWNWIRELFLNETDFVILKIMLSELRDSKHDYVTSGIIDAKRNQLTMLLQAINDVAPLDNL